MLDFCTFLTHVGLCDHSAGSNVDGPCDKMNRKWNFIIYERINEWTAALFYSRCPHCTDDALRPYNVVVSGGQDEKAVGSPHTEAACLTPLLPVSGHS